MTALYIYNADYLLTESGHLKIRLGVATSFPQACRSSDRRLLKDVFRLSPLTGKTNMQNGQTSPPAPSRPWQIIAQELSHETDPKKIPELLQELNQALNEQKGPLPAPQPERPAKP